MTRVLLYNIFVLIYSIINLLCNKASLSELEISEKILRLIQIINLAGFTVVQGDFHAGL